MLTIGIIDDGIGAFSTLSKLKQAICANYICRICGEKPSYAKLKISDLYSEGRKAVEQLVQMGCNVIVISSVSLSTLCFKNLQQICPVDIYGCEAPVVHASTYTASGVLVAGCGRIVNKLRFANVIPCPMDDFYAYAEQCDEKSVVEYISLKLEPYEGKFDCIAIAESSMNLYKHCFSRVCPNVQIFDSLEGVSRRIRKKYKKFPKEEGFCTVIDDNGEKINEKFAIFLE